MTGGIRSKRSKLAQPRPPKPTEALFRALCRKYRIPMPLTEYRFHPLRRWRFDYAWIITNAHWIQDGIPPQMVALEVDGAIWRQGRHTRGGGWLKDTEKLNEAAALGWRLLRCTPDQLCTVEMITTIRRALALGALAGSGSAVSETERESEP